MRLKFIAVCITFATTQVMFSHNPSNAQTPTDRAELPIRDPEFKGTIG
jgi:hypothetical protein